MSKRCFMKTLTKEDILTIERQMYNKARDMDVAILNSLTEESSKEFVLDCLMMYMNRDGGFGNGLYIDSYNPNSSVYQTYEALRILDMLNFSSDCSLELFEEITNKAGNYLFNRCPLVDGAWNPTVKTNDDFAHSEEFNYYENFMPFWGYHPTAAILGFCLTLFKPTKAYYKKALKQLGYVFSYLETKDDFSYNEFISFNSLLGSLRKANVFKEEAEIIENKLKLAAKKHIHEPNFSAPSFLSNCQKLDPELQQAVEEKLDEIIDKRASHGLWEKETGWGSTRYPEADSAMLKWLGAKTVEVLALLEGYGRIER